ncbi:hypothetical protein Scep_004590 [Stephania cephalantha]|uniref:Protein kinase domain-containing protein n=1 Tax=Stephania cephalantha TaxID=152367 RepID=A0AAP0KSR2_9MAGN
MGLGAAWRVADISKGSTIVIFGLGTVGLLIKLEIETMKLIKHPNVVQLYGVMGSKTKIFIVLEFVTGGELFNKIVNQGRMGEDEAKRYFQQLINVVDYCHSSVYHLDLKPKNLLLDARRNLKVSYFGLSALSKQVRDDDLLHTTCGTSIYGPFSTIEAMMVQRRTCSHVGLSCLCCSQVTCLSMNLI